jgi:hypothetical protein
VTIEALIGAVPPPVAPWEAFSGPWGPVEAELGTRLPADYKDFARVYGRGYFMEFLGVDIPRASNRHCRLETKVRLISDSFADHIADYDELPCPLWPDTEGLLAFGQTDNGHYLLWVTCGEPDEWCVAVWHPRDASFEELDCGLTDFLAGLAKGELIPKDFPDDLVVCEHLFQPDHKAIAQQTIRPVPASSQGLPSGVGLERPFQLTWRLGVFAGSSASRVRKGG